MAGDNGGGEARRARARLGLAAAALVLACGDPPPPDEPLAAAAAEPVPTVPAVAPAPAGAFELPGLDAQRPPPHLGWPVHSVHLTSHFGWRVDPVSGRGVRLHRGVDFRGAPGDLVVSIGAGEVEFVGHDPFLGTMVIVDHGEGLRSLYGHLSDVLVATRMPVERGAALGLVGNTGRSAAPHLHLTVTLDGRAIDPLQVLGEPLHPPGALATSLDAATSTIGAPAPTPTAAPSAGAPGDPPPESTPRARPRPRHPLPQRSDDGGDA